ncbi:MAG TPA: hypothetical protein ENN33_07115 [Ignavibacteria bacterium]|nr:hypothetical protein [Ignavibacteria bacterium]
MKLKDFVFDNLQYSIILFCVGCLLGGLLYFVCFTGREKSERLAIQEKVIEIQDIHIWLQKELEQYRIDNAKKQVHDMRTWEAKFYADAIDTLDSLEEEE